MLARARWLTITTLAVAALTGACAGVPVVGTLPPGATLQPIPTVPSVPSVPGLPASLAPFATLMPIPTVAVTFPPQPSDPGPGGPIGRFTPWPAPPATPEPSGYDPIVGRWNYADEFTDRQLIFLPDGRYGATYAVGDATLSEDGTYSADGSTVHLSPEGDEPATYEMAVIGDTLTISGGDLPAPVPYTLEPGSADAVVAEQEAFDQQQAALDEQWRERLPVAPMMQQPIHIPVGEVPDDPNVANVFSAPTVFVAPNLYVDLSLVDITFTDGSTGQVQASTKWFFQPTGRVHTVFTTWPQGRFHDRANPQPDVATYWSAYTIEAGGDHERVAIQTDAGEQIDTYLAHGRRNLIWGNDLYGQVDWENELLNQNGGG